MRNPKEDGAFSADIPADAIADALRAVERSGKRGAPAPDAVEVTAEVAAPPAGAAPAAPAATAAGPADVPASSGAEEVARLRAELELSQEQARKVFGQLKDEHDRLLRAAADLDNYKKRAAKERDEVQKYGNERLVKELLPVLDNLDRALAAAGEESALKSGVELTRRMLVDALGRFGVKSFASKGESFDPRLHEALMTVATADAPPGTVVEEQQRGWFFHERLIRPAAVVVAAAPPPAPAGAPGTTDQGPRTNGG